MARIFPNTRRVVVQSGGGGWVDDYSAMLELVVADTLTASDAHSIDAEATYTDTQAAPSESLEFGLSGYVDAQTAPTDARDSLMTRWATAHTTGGTTAPTNPTNAYGERNGTVATVKAGGVANGSSTLNLRVVAPFGEIPAGSTRTLRAYYSTNPLVSDSYALAVAWRQVGQASDTTSGMSLGNHLVSGFAVTLTNIDPTFPVVATFAHAATAPATAGSLTVDAVGIETQGAL